MCEYNQKTFKEGSIFYSFIFTLGQTKIQPYKYIFIPLFKPNLMIVWEFCIINLQKQHLKQKFRYTITI